MHTGGATRAEAGVGEAPWPAVPAGQQALVARHRKTLSVGVAVGQVVVEPFLLLLFPCLGALLPQPFHVRP